MFYNVYFIAFHAFGAIKNYRVKLLKLNWPINFCHGKQIIHSALKNSAAQYILPANGDSDFRELIDEPPLFPRW